MTRLRRHAAAIAAVCALALAAVACSSELSLTEYGEQVESLVDDMNNTLDRLDAEAEAAPSLEATRRYIQERVKARNTFVEGFGAIDPPEDAMELHDAALGIMGRLADAEAALAARVYELETDVGMASIWLTPEGIAARRADAAAIELCLSAQSEFDRTEMRKELGDVPWVPPAMKEVVLVTFGCIADER